MNIYRKRVLDDLDEPEKRENNLLMAKIRPPEILDGATPRLIGEWLCIRRVLLVFALISAAFAGESAVSSDGATAFSPAGAWRMIHGSDCASRTGDRVSSPDFDDGEWMPASGERRTVVAECAGRRARWRVKAWNSASADESKGEGGFRHD